MTVNLSAEWTEYIGKQMATGAYNSVDEVLDAALRVWRRHSNGTERNGEALSREAEALNEELKAGVTTGREYPAIRAAVQVGIDQLDRGEGILVDS
jgi:putative addiction module CopG family antidote